MKKLIPFILLYQCSFFTLTAQDQIVLRSGETLEAKVMEILPSQIKYKRFDHLDGPMVIIEKASVFLIRYENGQSEVINSLDGPRSQPAPEPAPAVSNPITYPAASSNTPRTPTPTYTAPNSANQTHYRPVVADYNEDEFLFRAGVSIPMGYEFGTGFSLGLERAFYFSPGLAFTSHISSSLNNGEIYFQFLGNDGYLYEFNGKGGLLDVNFLVGLQARMRSSGAQGYFTALFGSTWSNFTGDFSEADSYWSWALGGGGGVIFNDQIDLSIRFIHKPEDGTSNLQAGLGIIFE